MKKLTLILGTMGLTASVAVAFMSSLTPWFDQEKPKRSLPDAYNLAMQALGPATNEFHCFSAECARGRELEAMWAFRFCNTTNKHITVGVDMEPRYDMGTNGQPKVGKDGQPMLAPLVSVWDR